MGRIDNKDSFINIQIAPYASTIINGIYWAPNSPKLLTIPDAKVMRIAHVHEESLNVGRY